MVELSNKLSLFENRLNWFLDPENISKDTKFVTLDKVLSELQLDKCAAILDFTLPNMVMTKHMVSLDSLTLKILGKDTKVLSLVHFVVELWGWFYAMAAILDAILNFTPSARDPDCPSKICLLT